MGKYRLCKRHTGLCTDVYTFVPCDTSTKEVITHKHKLNNKTYFIFLHTKMRIIPLTLDCFQNEKIVLYPFVLSEANEANAKCHVYSIWVLASHSEGRQDRCHLAKPNKFKHESGVTEGDNCIRQPFPSEQAPTSILLKSVESSSHTHLIHFLSCCCHSKIAVKERPFNSVIGG